MGEGSDEVVIRLGNELMTLYHLGYISEDIAKALALAHDDSVPLTDYRGSVFGPRDGLELFRNDARLVENLGLLRLKRVDSGSIELVLAGATLLATIFVPILIFKVQAKAGTAITFEVRCKTPGVMALINRLADGGYGSGPQSIQHLLDDLRRRGVNISVTSEHVYKLEAIADRYASKIARVTRVSVR